MRQMTKFNFSIKKIRVKNFILLGMLSCVFLNTSQAENKVVVIPLFGEDVELTPTTFIADDSPSTSDYFVSPILNFVRDTKTQLTWQKNTDPTTLNFFDAREYCANFNILGQTDWRLPTITELQSLIDYDFGPGQPAGTALKAINLDVFPDTFASQYWSNTLVAGSLSAFGSVWDVDFSSGAVHSTGYTWQRYVRCVRST